MQEQVNEKTIALVIRAAKLTSDMLAKAMRKMLDDMERQRQTGKIPHGKQSVKELMSQNAGATNIEITDNNIKSFERVAKKYGIDFALKKEHSTPPKWLVFFKARDEGAMTAAFTEYTDKTLKRSADKPSLLAALRKNIELVKNKTVDKVRNKDKRLER